MRKLKTYYRQIRRWVPCGGKWKRRMMQGIISTIEAYRAECPEADFEALQMHFGTPQQIAAAFVDEMQTQQLLKELRIRRRIMRIVSGFFILITVFCFIALFALWMNDAAGYGIMGPAEIIS